MNKKVNKRSSELEHESQIAIAMTVLWMLSALATMMAEVMWVATHVASLYFPDQQLLQGLPQLALFIGCVTAGCTLLVTPVVLRIRSRRPPSPITWGVLAIAIAAIGLALSS